jgi:hypothetical protein
MIVKDVEKILKNIRFSKLSNIKEKLLSDILEDELNEKIFIKKLDLDELDQIAAAKGADWWEEKK